MDMALVVHLPGGTVNPLPGARTTRGDQSYGFGDCIDIQWGLATAGRPRGKTVRHPSSP